MGVAAEPEEFRNVGAGLTATANAGGENKTKLGVTETDEKGCV
jgi:hypothetical protein